METPEQREYRPPCFEDGVNVKMEDESAATELNAAGCRERRSIQWLDNHGKELTEVREFEPRYISALCEASESEDSDDDHEDLLTSCTCVIQ